MGGLLALVVAFVLSFGFGLLYVILLYWMDRFEKEPKLLVTAVFLWGALVATIGAVIIELVFDVGFAIVSPSELIRGLLGASIGAPLAEEALKSLAVLLVFLLFRKEFDSILDGIIYAGVVALGFAATENVLYLLGNYVENGWGGLFVLFFIRIILGGWAHPLYTSFCGMGLAMARMSRNIAVRILAPLAGLAVGMFLHGLNNGILVVGNSLGALGTVTVIEWGGWVFVFAVMLWAQRRESQWAKKYLLEELQHNDISAAQYATAASAWKQFWLGAQALFSGRYRATSRFYQVCGELVHKKHQVATLGDEGGYTAIIQKLRDELAHLAPVALA